MIRNLSVAFNYDQLYIGGGNAKEIFGKFPANVRLVSNELGLAGGVRLWFPEVKAKRQLLRAA